GERRRLACWFWRLAKTILSLGYLRTSTAEKVRYPESIRGRKHARHVCSPEKTRVLLADRRRLITHSNYGRHAQSKTNCRRIKRPALAHRRRKWCATSRVYSNVDEGSQMVARKAGANPRKSSQRRSWKSLGN